MIETAEITEILRRELIYIFYYFQIQLSQIFGYWIIGMAIGSFISVFAKEGIHSVFSRINQDKWGLFGLIPACILGILSPLCMYGTIPVAASFSRQGMRDDYLASFMMASILLNPQLIIYSLALGGPAAVIRLVTCSICGIAAGLLVYTFYRETPFFNFHSFAEPVSRDTHPNPLIRYLKNFLRNVRATGVYFLTGILLSALFQHYMPHELMVRLFGGDRAWGVLMAATIGVPMYACGGGTIPLLQEWIWNGMSLGSAAAFMITGPSTKITNLGALKIVLGARHFLLYIGFVMLYSLICGITVNILL